jgi:hypothetical protein
MSAVIVVRRQVMSTKRGPRYSKIEFARRGDEIFEREVRAHLSGENPSHFLAIDIETGDFEIDENEMKACDRLHERKPDAQIWLRKVGSRYARKFGGRFD